MNALVNDRLASRVRALTWLVLCLFAFATLNGCRRLRTTLKRQPTMSAKARRGKALYRRYCALCHGPTARGYAADHANAIGNPDFLSVASRDYLRASIVEGRPGTPMSAWGRAYGGPLETHEVDEIVAYLRTFARKPSVRVSDARVTGDAEHGRGIWNERCQTCHGARAEGTSRATSLSHPHFLRAASDGFLHATIEHGRAGTEMAGFGAQLPSQSIDDVIVYIRSLEAWPGPPPPPEYEPPPGLERLVINPSGAQPRFTLREGRFVASADVAKALEEGKKLIILDARATSDWSRGHIAGALPFPFYNIEEMAGRIPRDGTWVLAYCACPHAASGHVVDELRRRGFTHTAVIDEGINFWTTHGYPTAAAAIVHR